MCKDTKKKWYSTQTFANLHLISRHYNFIMRSQLNAIRNEGIIENVSVLVRLYD